MEKISSGLSLSTEYFMRNFYINNRNVISANGRNNYSKLELSFEDSRALHKAAKHLVKADYGAETDNSDIDETTKSSIEAFVKTYNNTLDSSKSDDYDTQRALKQMKSLSNKYKDELGDIGITVESNGKLTIKEDLLKVADKSKVRKVFSKENEFSKKAFSISKQMNESIRNNLLAESTGNGKKINICL